MVLSEEKWARLTNILTCLRRISRDVGTSRQHALAFATAAPSPTLSNPEVMVPLAAVQSSPTPLPCKGKAVVIESDEDSSEGSISKRPKPTPVMHSSSIGRSVSPRDHTIGVPLLPDLGGTGASTPPVLELPLVLQHAIKGFQQGVIANSDEAAARERLGFNFGALLAQSDALLTRAESGENSLLAHSFVAREATLREKLVHLSKLLHAKRREVTELEARVLSLQIWVFELEEADEVSQSKITESISHEAQLGRVEAELHQQAKRFEEAEVELTGDVLDAYDEGFRDALAQVACAHPGLDITPFTVSNCVENGQIVPKVLP